MKFLQNIRQKFFSIGLTEQELKVIFFLILAFFIGLALKLFKENYPQYEKFDYTYVDSLFTSHKSGIDIRDNVFIMGSDTAILNALNERQSTSKKGYLPPDKKININNASITELCLLPDIGIKTAETIIEHRTKFGKFKSIEGIMKVKGIGKKKYDKMKNNITIVENE
jgi:comEA protein